MTQPAVLIGARDGDPDRIEIPGAQTRPCCECDHPTWFSPATLNSSYAQFPTSKFMCINCALGDGKADGLIMHPATPEQIAEREAAGHTGFPGRELWNKTLRRP